MGWKVKNLRTRLFTCPPARKGASPLKQRNETHATLENDRTTYIFITVPKVVYVQRHFKNLSDWINVHKFCTSSSKFTLSFQPLRFIIQYFMMGNWIFHSKSFPISPLNSDNITSFLFKRFHRAKSWCVFVNIMIKTQKVCERISLWSVANNFAFLSISSRRIRPENTFMLVFNFPIKSIENKKFSDPFFCCLQKILNLVKSLTNIFWQKTLRPMQPREHVTGDESAKTFQLAVKLNYVVFVCSPHSGMELNKFSKLT